MMKYLFSALAAIAFAMPAMADVELTGETTVASAELDAAAFGTCQFDARMDVRSIHIIVGGVRGVGRGRITCSYTNGRVEVLPVMVTTEGVGLGLGASRVRARLLAAHVGYVYGGARALTGDYVLTSLGGRLVRIGGEVAVGLTASRNGFSLPLGLQAQHGWGLELAANLGRLRIVPLR